MLRVGNFVPAISLEGFETATDGRRGNGVYQKVIKAINLLREKKLVFGISACYTSANFESSHIRGILRQPDRSWSVLYLVFPLYAGWK